MNINLKVELIPDAKSEVRRIKKYLNELVAGIDHGSSGCWVCDDSSLLEFLRQNKHTEDYVLKELERAIWCVSVGKSSENCLVFRTGGVDTLIAAAVLAQFSHLLKSVVDNDRIHVSFRHIVGNDYWVGNLGIMRKQTGLWEDASDINAPKIIFNRFYNL